MAGNSITITHNTPEVMAKLGQMPGYVGQTVDRAMATGASHVTKSAIVKAPKADMELTKAIQQERITLLEHHIRAAKDYASYQEEGTGPGGRPSLDRMLQWIARKGITPRNGMSVRSLAQLIRRKIARDGVPAQPYMAPALEENRSRLDGLFRAAVTRGLAAIEQGRAL